MLERRRMSFAGGGPWGAATHHGERYRLRDASAGRRGTLNPENWLLGSPVELGSWWPAWAKWLHEHSNPHVDLPQMGAEETACTPLCDAPELYVLAE